VLTTARETVTRFMDAWHDGRDVREVSPKAVAPIKTLLGKIPLVGEACDKG